MYVILRQTKHNVKMKNGFLNFFSVLLTMTALSLVLSSASTRTSDEYQISLKSSSASQRPRSEITPPYCYYSQGTVNIICTDAIAGIQVSVVREIDEQEWIDQANGNSISMYVSEETGDYSIVIVLSDGSEWVGNYSLP